MNTRNAVMALGFGGPALLLGFSTGPVIQRTGATVDGGLNCTACHRTYAPANSDPRGSVVISTGPYAPGVKQTVMVTVSHPLQKRWGFQLIARLASDETQQAGTFAVDDIVRVRCTNTADAPCSGAVEYAEHKDAPFTAVGAGYTFMVTWTPPATNVGDVHFYAAGNAANGDGSFNGDYVYTTKLFIPPAGTCNISAKPVVTGIVNAASYTPSCGPGTLLSIFGSGFNLPGTHATPDATTLASGFPKQLACVAVEVNGTRSPVIFSGESQINIQVPQSVTAGPATVRVLLNPDTPNQVASDPTTVTAQAVSPAFLTYAAGSAAATLPNTYTPVADPSVVSGGVSVQPGSVIMLWGTGFGPTSPAFPEGAIVSGRAPIAGTVSVSIGGVAVSPTDISYAGLVPGAISALYQLNVRVPMGLPDGPASVVAQVGGASTQSGLSIPVHQ